MKNQPPAAAASTATTMPIIMTGDLPDFSSPPELPLEGAVTALSASAVEEMRAASLIARSIGPVSTGESTSAWMAPSSISASTMPAEAPSRIAMTTGLCGLAEIGAKSSGFMPRRSATRMVRVPGLSMVAAVARLSAWRKLAGGLEHGPELCPQVEVRRGDERQRTFRLE